MHFEEHSHCCMSTFSDVHTGPAFQYRSNGARQDPAGACSRFALTSGQPELLAQSDEAASISGEEWNPAPLPV